MLHPIFGIQFGNFPIYQLMMLTGFIVGWILLGKALKPPVVSPYIKRRIRGSMVWGALVGLLTANVANWFLIDGLMHYSVQYRLTHGGFTFYFGMLAFLGVSALLLRLRKIPVLTALNAVIPSLLMAHFLGRIGCSLRGCCWGIAIGSGHFPARELEALALLALFIVFTTAPKLYNKRLPMYLFSYSAFRFFMEFFRGDNRGSLFGISVLSPTQLVSLIVILVSGVWLFLYPHLRKAKQETAAAEMPKHQADHGKQKTPYTPLPLNASKPEPRHKALRILALILAGCLLIGSIAVTWNPLSIPVFDSIKDGVSALLTESRGGASEIGDGNSTTVIPLLDYGVVTDAKAAQSVADSLDAWSDAQFTHTDTQTLPSGNVMYVFEQVVLDQPVLGRERVLVTDANGNTLYAVGDAAQLTFTDEVTDPAARRRTTTAEPSIQHLLKDGIKVLSKGHYWIDTGDGLVPRMRYILGENEKTPMMGVVVDMSTGDIVCYTDAHGKVTLSEDYVTVQLVCTRMKHLLETEDDDKIRQQSTLKIKKNSPDQQYDRLLKALSKAYLKSDLPKAKFKDALVSAEAVATGVSELNIHIFCDIMVQETQTLMEQNYFTSTWIKRTINRMQRAFERCGIKQTKDQAAMAITVRERKNTHRFSIDFPGDADVYTLDGLANHTTNLTVEPDSPVKVEIYRADNKSALLSTYVQDKQTITLNPEDGHSFVLRVTDQRTGADTDRSHYKLSVMAIPGEEQFPDYIVNTLDTVKRAYANSNLAQFISLIADENEGAFSIDESLAMGAFAVFADSCYACIDSASGVDTAKSTIVAGLVIDAEELDETFNALRNTDMELECVQYIVQNDATLVKARIGIRSGDMYLYEGYTFLKMKTVDNLKSDAASEDPDAEETRRTLASLFSIVTGKKYRLVDGNTDEILAAFGDTREEIHSHSDLTSLYDLWESKVLTDEYGYSVTIKTFDEEEALEDGHSYEKVKSFTEYTKRHNLTILKKEKAECDKYYSAILGTYEPIYTVCTLIDVISNPIGYVVKDRLKEDDLKDVKILYDVFVVSDPKALAADIVVDGLGDIIEEMKEEYRRRTASLDRWIKEIEG